jgi:S1-C subfamily serine protease
MLNWSKFISLVLRSALVAIVFCNCQTRSPETSEVFVANGIETAKYSAIVELDLSGIGRCTGSFINPTTVLTANHCVRDEKTGKHLDIFLITADGHQFGAKSKIFFDYPEMKLLSGHDVAIVTFDPEASKHAKVVDYFHIERPDRPVAVNDPIYMIGFGVSDMNAQTGGGVKRIGSNKVSSIDDSLIKVEGLSKDEPSVEKGRRSSIGSGDSGGPLVNQSGKIVGVSSHVYGFSDYSSQHFSAFANLSHQIPQTLLRAAYYCPEATYCAEWFNGANLGEVSDLGLNFRISDKRETLVRSVSQDQIGAQKIYGQNLVERKLLAIEFALADLSPFRISAGQNSAHTTMAINQLYRRGTQRLISGDFIFDRRDAAGQEEPITVTITPRNLPEFDADLQSNIKRYSQLFGQKIALSKQPESARPPRYTMGFRVAPRAHAIGTDRATKDRPRTSQSFGLTIVEVLRDSINADIFQEGDILLSINGRPIDSLSALFDSLNSEDLMTNQKNRVKDELGLGVATIMRAGEFMRLEGVKARLRWL